MSSVWDRRNRRISYQVPVGVVDLKAKRVLNMSSINVSRGGIFVDTDANLHIGAPVVCNLPFDRDEIAMQLRGRVAWLRPKSSSTPNRPGGVGIEFVDLSDEESDKLSDLVGRNEEQSHLLSVKLPGLSNPVRGQAFLTPRGVFFRSKLPFLALDSDVDFVFDDEDDELVYDGKIVGVDVFNDPGSPVPRLQVEIAVKAEDMPSVGDIPEGDKEGHEYDMLHIDNADTERTFNADEEALASEAMQNAIAQEALAEADESEPLLADASEGLSDADESDEDLVIEIPQMLPIVVAEVSDPSIIEDELPVELTERVNPNAWPLKKVWPPVALLVGSIVGILAFALSGSDAKEDLAPAPSAEAAVPNQLTLAGLTPGTLADGPAAQEKTQETAAALDRIRTAALSEQEEFGDSPQDAMGAGLEDDATEVDKLPAADRKTAPERAVGMQERIGGVKIWENEAGQLVLRLPIEGKLERAADYPLADPPGLAINLPYAQPTEGFHESLTPHHERVRTLWVRERLGGLHMRAFFDETAQSCEVQYQATAVVVRCSF